MQQTQNLLLARVIGEEKELYRVQFSNQKTMYAHVPGRFIYTAQSRAEFPAVGDWVLCEPTGNNARVLITQIETRKSLIERATDSGDTQVIAANVDWLFIATSHNHDLNERRLERYVTLAYNSGCLPVIVLTKSDLSDEAEAVRKSLEANFVGVPVLNTTCRTDNGLSELDPYLQPGATVAVVGSSGVGKSTLVNRLLGEQFLETQEIREDDSKGRHTTTSRYLFVTPTGAFVIDTPGMRELQMTGDEEGLSETFSDIEVLIASCKFGDCSHLSEPGCKIVEALEVGELTNERWESYQKLLREIRFQQRKTNKALAKEERDRWKKIHKDMRAREKLKR